MKQTLGSIAFLLTLLISLPQAIKVVRTKRTTDLSLASYSLLVAASVIWVAYGLLIGDVAVWLANAISFFLAALIIAYKLRFG